jgi:hypothetical protein
MINIRLRLVCAFSLPLAWLMFSCSSAAPIFTEDAPPPVGTAAEALPVTDAGAPAPLPSEPAPRSEHFDTYDGGACILFTRKAGECRCASTASRCADSCAVGPDGVTVVHTFCYDAGLPFALPR